MGWPGLIRAAVPAASAFAALHGFNILPTLLEMGLIAIILLGQLQPHVCVPRCLGFRCCCIGSFSIWVQPSCANRFVRESNKLEQTAPIPAAVDSLLNIRNGQSISGHMNASKSAGVRRAFCKAGSSRMKKPAIPGGAQLGSGV